MIGARIVLCRDGEEAAEVRDDAGTEVIRCRIVIVESPPQCLRQRLVAVPP
jgi:hypothetical protein